MRLKKLSLICAISSVFAFLILLRICGNDDCDGRRTGEQEIQIKLNEIGLRAGDLILRQGNGLWSNYISQKNIADHRFSHVGILVREGNAFFVVHADCDATGNGRVKKTSLKIFTDDAFRVGVFRLKNADANLCAETAKSFVGLPFDREFNLSDARKLYCSELAFRAMEKAVPDFKPKTIELCGKAIIPIDAVVPSEYTTELFDSGAK